MPHSMKKLNKMNKLFRRILIKPNKDTICHGQHFIDIWAGYINIDGDVHRFPMYTSFKNCNLKSLLKIKII
jgi:hypothetical protein